MQKFALRVCTKQWNLPYEDLIKKFQVPELSTRRNHLSLSLLHKVISGECILPGAPLSPYTAPYFTRSHGANRYVLPFAHTNVLKSSYFHRTISLWNALPAEITTTTSLVAFKRRLLCYHHLYNINFSMGTYIVLVFHTINVSIALLCINVS